MAPRTPSTKLPLAIFGIGVDIAYIPRFERCLTRYGDRFLRRALHPREIAELYAKPADAQPRFVAARWAAKEAAFKAFQRYRVLFPEICVAKRGTAHSTAAHPLLPVTTQLAVAETSLALRLQFSGETRALADQLGLADPLVSISHDENYAIAYVVLQQQQQQLVSSSPHSSSVPHSQTDVDRNA